MAIKCLTSDPNANRRLKGHSSDRNEIGEKIGFDEKKKIEISERGAGPKWVNDDGRQASGENQLVDGG